MANLSLVDSVIDELDNFRSTEHLKLKDIKRLVIDLENLARDIKESELVSIKE